MNGFTTEERQKIKDALPRQHSKDLIRAKLEEFGYKSDYHDETISRVINGRAKNTSILLAAYQVGEDHKAQIEAAKSKLNEIE